MKETLDLEPTRRKQDSWKTHSIVNSILAIIFLFLFSMENLNRNKYIDSMEVLTFTFCMLFLITFISPISLLISKKYWKKWLIISALSFVPTFIIAVSNSYIKP